jgi:trigger factor
MTQVQETLNKGLQREFSVKVPAASVEADMTSRLTEIAKTAKQPGFRPGKMPMEMVRRMYGAGARAEVVDDVISKAANQTLKDRNLRPAMQPKVEIVTFAEGKDLEFKLAVDVLPEIVLGDFSKISVERPTAEITEAMIHDAIKRAAKAMREPEVVTDARAAKTGDVLVINFDGTVDGVARPGMKGEDHRLELGSKSFIDTFEDQLVGAKVGDKKTIKVTFPAEYHAPDLASKKAEFAVEVKELRAHKSVDMDDALGKDLGFPSFDKLQERVRDDLTANYAGVTKTIVKRQLLDKLAEMHTFDVPPVMLESEFEGIWKQVQDAKAKGDLPEEDKKKSDKDLEKEYRGIATRRIRLGLLLAEIAKLKKLEVAGPDLRNALMAEARRFPGQEKAVIDYYTQTEGALERIRAPLLEDKVVEHILSQAKVTEKTMAAEDLMKRAGEEE